MSAALASVFLSASYMSVRVARQWPEVYDSCHTFLDVARVKQHTAMRESHAKRVQHTAMRESHAKRAAHGTRSCAVGHEREPDGAPAAGRRWPSAAGRR